MRMRGGRRTAEREAGKTDIWGRGVHQNGGYMRTRDDGLTSAPLWVLLGNWATHRRPLFCESFYSAR